MGFFQEDLTYWVLNELLVEYEMKICAVIGPVLDQFQPPSCSGGDKFLENTAGKAGLLYRPEMVMIVMMIVMMVWKLIRI